MTYFGECDGAWRETPCEGELIDRTTAGGYLSETCEGHIYELEMALAGIAERYPEINHPEYCPCAGCDGAWG